MEISALALSPLYAHKDLLQADKYLKFYTDYATKDPEGKWDAIPALFRPIIEADTANKHSLLE